MENITIYSHYLRFEQILQIVKEQFPKAQIEHSKNGLHQNLAIQVKGGFFSKSKSLKINYRQRLRPSYTLDFNRIDCGLSQNLAGMLQFIQSIPTNKQELKEQFLIKVKTINCEIAIIASPKFDSSFRTVVQKIVQVLDGFIFTPAHSFSKEAPNQHFLDKELQLLFDQNGRSNVNTLSIQIDAQYGPMAAPSSSEEQIQRKVKSEKLLAAKGIKINANLPLLPSSKETTIRNKQTVIERAYALLIIALKGEGVEQVRLDEIIADKNIHSFSPKEKDLLSKPILNDQEKAYATWRYESLYTLLWSLGVCHSLKYPNEICDVQMLVRSIFHPDRTSFEENVQLRKPELLLDELDQTYRMHWACVDARIKGNMVGGNILPSIIYERHYTLNWLTNYLEQEWDHVQTNT